MNIKLEKLKSEICLGKFDDLKKKLAELPKYSQVLVITDGNVAPLFLGQVMAQLGKNGKFLILPAGEGTKSLDHANQCWEEMHKLGLDRLSLIIGLGGGVVTDLAGFVAATYMRGVDLVLIPTSLMGMVDASIGGKNAINLASGKNIIGTILQPRLIFVDPSILKALPARELRSGLAECIKHGIIWNPSYFEMLENSMPKILKKEPKKLQSTIWTSCQIKAEIVQLDPLELDKRALLNFGHTFAHALETITHYKRYSHGEAVAIGISCAAHLSHAMGLCSAELVHRIDSLCQQAGLETALPTVDLDQFIELMAHDKKAVKYQIHLILVHDLGKVSKAPIAERKIIKTALKTKLIADDSK